MVKQNDLSVSNLAISNGMGDISYCFGESATNTLGTIDGSGRFEGGLGGSSRVLEVVYTDLNLHNPSDFWPGTKGYTPLTFLEWMAARQPRILTQEQSEHYLAEGAVAVGIDLPIPNSRHAPIFDRSFKGGRLAWFSRSDVTSVELMEMGDVITIRHHGDRGISIDAGDLKVKSPRVEMNGSRVKKAVYFATGGGTRNSYLLGEPGALESLRIGREYAG